MALRDRFNAAWAAFRQEQGTVDKTTSTEMPKPARSSTALADVQRHRRSRLQMIDASRVMYDGDLRAQQMIDTVARDSTRGGFTVVTDDQAARQIADDLIKRLKLQKLLDDWMRYTLRDGDSFLEIEFNDDSLIVGVSRKPTKSMNRNSNKLDRFDDPLRAYWQSVNRWQGIQTAPPPDAIWYAEWQMIHARYAHDSASRYGRTMYHAALDTFKYMTKGERSVHVRRVTRAGIRYNHYVPGDKSTIETYQDINQDALERDDVAIADFFSNVQGGISVVAGDANIGQLADILHHISTFFLASPTPKSLIGYGEEINRDVLEKQQDQYYDALLPFTEFVSDQFVIPLIELQWLFAGLYPPGIEYEIKWHPKRPLTAADIKAATEAATQLRALGVDEKIVQQVLQMFMPQINIGELTPPPTLEGDAGRLAAIIAGMQ